MHASPTNAESVFNFDEMFYSRTDLKGRILSGNSVFRRVSGFEWEELETKPHNVIRHPDMPRAVFSLLWKFIQAGKPIGAYVKNRSKDGGYYWVFALAMPVEGGYLSVRIKPGSGLFAVVQQEYASLLAREQSEGLKPERAAELLLARIQELGFSSYEAFMTEAIRAEVGARRKALNKGESRGLVALESLTKAVQGSIDEARAILASYEECLLVPINLEARAARLGAEGGQISVVSETYRSMMAEIRDVIGSFSGMAEVLSSTAREASFLFNASTVINDLTAHLARTGEVPLGGGVDEIQNLRALAERYRALALSGMADAELAVSKFKAVSLQLRRLGGNLQVVRVSGLIGATQFPQQRAELEGEFEKLRVFQEALKKGLKTIVFASERMLFDCDVARAEASGAS